MALCVSQLHTWCNYQGRNDVLVDDDTYRVNKALRLRGGWTGEANGGFTGLFFVLDLNQMNVTCEPLNSHGESNVLIPEMLLPIIQCLLHHSMTLRRESFRMPHSVCILHDWL